MHSDRRATENCRFTSKEELRTALLEVRRRIVEGNVYEAA